MQKQCPICEKKFFGRGKTCSKEHANQLKKQTNIEKFGSEWAIQSDGAKDKRKATNIERYGAEHHLQTDESMAKLRATNLERYGVEYIGQSEDARAKIRETNLERYGYEYSFGSPEILDKVNATNLIRYGVKRPLQNTEIQARAAATIAEGLSSGRIQLNQRVSKLNRSFAAALNENLGVAVELEVSRENHSFDLYIPEKSLFIELNPTISHNADRSYSCMINSHDFNCGHGGTDRSYHQKRALFARDNGLKLI